MKSRTRRFSNTLALAAPGAILMASQAGAAFDAYLKIDGIEGEVASPGFEDQIDILSWSWGASNPVSVGGAGKVVFQDLVILKHVDKSSPKLFLACATGDLLPEFTLRITRPSPDGTDPVYYTITLHDVLISGVKSERPKLIPGQAADTSGLPTEEVSFKFDKISWTYRQMDRVSGELGEPVSATAVVER